MNAINTIELDTMTLFDRALAEGRIKGNFATSLSNQASGRFNKLSVKQQEWVIKLLNDAVGDTVSEKPLTDKVGKKGDDFRFFIESLQKANSSKAFIRLAFESPEGIPNIKKGTIRLSLASSGSSNAGCVYVKYSPEGEEDIYLGKIHPNRGGLECPASISHDLSYHVCALLRTVNDTDSLVVAAKKYAFVTSSCSFCAIALTDKRSIAVGYGPHCAQNYSLPWG